MLDTAIHLLQSDFPAIHRHRLQTVQANLGYRCNQSCSHCHVAASPKRTEMMSWETMDLLLQFCRYHRVETLDLTGGAPEMNPHFRRLVEAARADGLTVSDRCNLSILSAEGYEDLPDFFAQHQVTVIASLPCYQEETVDKQRGFGVFESSIAGLQKLNAKGYGQPESGLFLHLVYNPAGPVLPPAQEELSLTYKRELSTQHGIVFNQLFAIANMPIKRFGSQLLAASQFEDYMILLKQAHQAENLQTLMCRSQLSVDWQGQLFDCDFNQILNLSSGHLLEHPNTLKAWLENLSATPVGQSIRVADHCYGCTAGQGSSCGGALEKNSHMAASCLEN